MGARGDHLPQEHPSPGNALTLLHRQKGFAVPRRRGIGRGRPDVIAPLLIIITTVDQVSVLLARSARVPQKSIGLQTKSLLYRRQNQKVALKVLLCGEFSPVPPLPRVNLPLPRNRHARGRKRRKTDGKRRGKKRTRKESTPLPGARRVGDQAAQVLGLIAVLHRERRRTCPW